VFRPEALGPGLRLELTLIHELALIPELKLTVPGLGARTASVLVERSPGETENCTPMRQRPWRQLRLFLPPEVLASLSFHVFWPAY
jgi:hypothetical protein